MPLCVASPAPPPSPHLPTPPLSLIRCDQSLTKALKQRLLYIEMFTNINSSGKEIMCMYYFIIYSVITVQNMTEYMLFHHLLSYHSAKYDCICVISSFTQWSQCKRWMHICYIIIYSVTAVQKINGYMLFYHLLCYHSAKDECICVISPFTLLSRWNLSLKAVLISKQKRS